MPEARTRFMLSRVADSLYWMSRYIERAESIGRLLEVNLQLLLDFAHVDDEKVKEHWEPIIRSTGDEKLFYELYDEANNETVTDFLTFNERNPNSVQSCLFAARENARVVRDQISGEMWEVINELFLFLRSRNARQVWESGAHEFYAKIKNYSHLFQGLTDSTFSRDEGYEFIQFGKYLERADKTTRILDIKYHILLPSANDVGGAVDVAQWQAVLRSTSGLESYHRIYVADVQPWKVAEFLIFSDTFPRSIKFCVRAIDHFIHRISGTPSGTFANEAERLSGKMLSDLTFSRIDDVFQRGLHEYLDDTQQRLNEIGEAVFRTFMYTPAIDMEHEINEQRQSQPPWPTQFQEQG